MNKYSISCIGDVCFLKQTNIKNEVYYKIISLEEYNKALKHFNKLNKK